MNPLGAGCIKIMHAIQLNIEDYNISHKGTLIKENILFNGELDLTILLSMISLMNGNSRTAQDIHCLIIPTYLT